jgi:hypothetical protein
MVDKLLRIRGVTWEWGPEAVHAGQAPGAPGAGVIAQEVEAVFPEFVTERHGFKHVNYQGLVGALIEAVRALDGRLRSLEGK